jgi:hypothetical protein
VTLAHVPSVALFGDYRVGLALCVPAAVLLLRAAGRKLGASPSTIDVATVALALHPRLVHSVAFGFTEPMMLVVLGAFVYFQASAPGGVAQAIAFLLLPAFKQYVAAPVLLYPSLRPKPRAIAVGLGVAAATVVPLLVWNWRATWDGLFFQLRQHSFRADSISLSALVAWATGWQPPQWIGVASQFVAGGLAFALGRRRGLGRLLLASAIALHTSFLLGSQAFQNYYLFVEGLYLFAALALAEAA